MSALADQFGDLGGSLEKAIEAEVERRVKGLVGDIGTEVALQLGPVIRHQQTEKTVADDRHELIMKNFDELKRQLGTNGSGGHG